MTGLDGFGVLAVALNIVQAVCYCYDVINVARRIQRDGTVDDTVGLRLFLLSSYASDIQHVLETESPGEPPSAEHQTLLRAALLCKDTAREIETIVSKLAEKSAWPLKISLAIKMAKLRGLEGKLKEVGTGLLTNVVTRVQPSLVNLATNLDRLLQQSLKTHRDVSELIADDGADTRQHVTSEVNRAIDTFSAKHGKRRTLRLAIRLIDMPKDALVGLFLVVKIVYRSIRELGDFREFWKMLKMLPHLLEHIIANDDNTRSILNSNSGALLNLLISGPLPPTRTTAPMPNRHSLLLHK